MMVGVLLAAGASTRMGRSKPLMKVRGQSFLMHGIRHLWAACDRVVVVLGSDAAAIRDGAEKEFERLVKKGEFHRDVARRGSSGLEVEFIVNRAWKHGMLSSARAGLKAALALRPKGVIVLPVDHPAVRGRTVIGLAGVMEEALGEAGTPRERARFAYALVPRYLRRRGHPLALSPALARAIASDTGAETLSDAVRRNARLMGYLDVSDPGVVLNRNTPGVRK